MKVIHQSDTQLVIEDRPWLLGFFLILMAWVFVAGCMSLIVAGQVLGGLLLALVGIGVPLLIGALMVKRVRVTLDRAAGQMTRTCRSVRGLTQAHYALDRLTAARVGASVDSDGTTWRLEFLLSGPAETVPLTSYYSSSRKPERLCVEVNDWLGRPG